MEKKKKIVDIFCCDMAAKSFILSTKGHNGYKSCTRCTVPGLRMNCSMTFLETNYPKRSHLDFINRIDDEHHVSDNISLLTEIPYINMIDNFSLDYLHLVCLGVTKKMILLWLGILKNAPLNVRIQSREVKNISNHLLSLKNYITSDFSRKPREINEVSRRKATEFRTFVLYLGPVVLKNILSDECYFHFICLHIGIIILLSTNSITKLVNFSEQLLIHFVEKFEEIYGGQFLYSNVMD